MIESPGYPGNYPHSRNCEWRVTVESGRQILLNVTSFNVEPHTDCDYDYLEIRCVRDVIMLHNKKRQTFCESEFFTGHNYDNI